MFEERRWNAAWERIGVPAPPSVLARLEAAYAEPHRAYHTLQHLRECFAMLDSAVALADRPAEVELALWFHDAIYDTRALDSEERSARWARESLAEAGAASAIADRVEQLVLVTKHSGVPDGIDAQLLIDVDLSILGAGAERFDEYERQVRREFAWVPDPAFCEARKRILASFLGRPRIYATAWFTDRLEARARENLERSLRTLDRPPGGD